MPWKHRKLARKCKSFILFLIGEENKGKAAKTTKIIIIFHHFDELRVEIKRFFH